MKLLLPTDLLRVFKPAFVSLVFMASVPTTALALNKAQAIKGCLDNTLSQLEKSELLLDMETWTTVFSSFVQENAGTCFTNLTGEPAEFVNNTGFILGEAGLMALEAARNLVETEKLEAQAAAEEAQAAAEEAQAAAEEAQATAEAERIERQRVQSELETELAKLEKHNSCISAKRSELLSDIEAVDIQNNETNNSLIINDTYSACSELYLKDKSSVMLNQSCIDAFKRLGHPNLVLAGDELKSSFMDQLGELSTLRANLVMEQNRVTDELRTFLGFSNLQDIRSAALEALGALEEKSCAEFGYEGIDRD
tara:strand:- start:34 stop:963 length:930 start_codon:yes stop_codon:yes gene_type:complete